MQPGLFAIAFFLPSVAWVGTLYASGIHYYNHEIAVHRQFVWVLDALIHSGFFSLLATLSKNTLEFLETFGSILFTTVFLLITVLLLKRKSLAKSNPGNHRSYIGLNTITIAVFAISLCFFWLLGSYADRLTFLLAPIVLFYTATYMNRYIISRFLQYALVLVMLLWHFYNVFFEALHFSDNFYN